MIVLPSRKDRRATAGARGNAGCRSRSTSIRTSARATPAARRWRPELFELDHFGNAHEIGDGAVGEALVDKAWLAKSNCPENAIDITES